MHPYLIAATPEIVRIEEGGSIWVWKNNDATAAFATQLAEILENIADLLGGLPTITSVLCVASSLRHWESDAVWSDRLRLMMQHTDEAKERGDSNLTRLVRWFSRIASQSEELRSGTLASVSVFGCGLQGRSDLLEIRDKSVIAEIVQTLRIPSEDRVTYKSPKIVSEPEFKSNCVLTWKTLLHLCESISDPATVETWRKTGLREMPRVSEAPEADPPQTLHQTLELLEQDETYGGLARYSRMLSGMISLPRRLADPEDLPEGGVSDVSNRGNPERLLISELAADPMLLLARIANGQALYMRRESPSGIQASVRPVLVESSIHCWGMTRIRLAALAMAVASAERRRAKMTTEIYILESSRYFAIDGGTKRGIRGLIEGIHAGDHPGIALTKFFEDQTERFNAGDELAEPLLMVSGATLRNPEFRQMLDDLKRPVLLASVERNGTATIARRSAMGDEKLQSLTLELNSEHLRQQMRTTGKQPLFTTQASPPLAFSLAGREQDWMANEHASGDACTWIITHDQRLLCFTSPLHGGDEVIDSVPRGQVRIYSASNTHLDFVLAQSNGKHAWMQVDVKNRSMATSELGPDKPEITYGLSGPFLLRFDGGAVEAFNRSDGKSIVQYETGRRHIGFSYQATDDNAIWTHGGGAPHDWHCIGKILFPHNRSLGGIVYQRKEVWGVSDDLGWMAPLGMPDQVSGAKSVEIEPKLFGPPIKKARLIAANEWKKRWVFEENTSRAYSDPTSSPQIYYYQLDIEPSRKARLPSSHPADIIRSVYPTAYQLVRRKPIRRRARGVTLTNKGLLFEKESGVHFLVAFANNYPQRLTITAGKDTVAPEAFTQFGQPFMLSPSPHRTWTLRQAKIEGGTCWADSRGLFHFRRDDHPDELTLAFADSHIAGWFSATGVFGPKYFFPHAFKQREEVLLPHIVANWLKQWFQKAT